MLLAFGLLLAAQDPIADLDHDDPAVRDAAVRELRELRDCAETNLRSRLAAGASPEASARIRGLLAEIERERRIAAFPGGAEADGLRCAVTIDGGPHDGRRNVHLEILNVGPESREIPLVRSWDGRLPGNGWTRSGNEAEIRVRGGPPLGGGRYTASSGCGAGRPQELVSLRRGESRTFTYVLEAGKLRPGRYEVSVCYLALRMADRGLPEVVSNSVAFEVGDVPTVR